MSAAAPPPPPPPNNNNNPGRGGGKAKHFTSDETDLLLQLIKDRLPLGQIAWVALSDEFNAGVAPERSRDYAQLVLSVAFGDQNEAKHCIAQP